MLNIRQTVVPDRQQRRYALDNVQESLLWADDLCLFAVVALVFLYPLLFHPLLFLDLSVWSWWAKGFAWSGVLVWFAVRLLVSCSMIPAHVSGATVEAMEQTVMEQEWLSVTPVETECLLYPHRQVIAECRFKIGTRARLYRQKLLRRLRRRLFLNALHPRLFALAHCEALELPF